VKTPSLSADIRVWFSLLFVLIVAGGCASGPALVPPAYVPPSVALWPDGAPGAVRRDTAEVTKLQGTTAPAGVTPVPFLTVSNINNPSITPFLPTNGNATGAAVIVAPGGGHQFLSIDHEGYAVARSLAAHGVAAFVLKYRLAREPNSPYKVEVHALMDMQRAIRLVRADGGEWGVDPHRVGVMGFSAGGELVILASTRFDKPVAGSNDAVDQLSCRPDFQVLMYPGGLNNPQDVPISKQTPPAFMACAYNDRPTISVNLVQFYLRLKAMGVPAELHVYNSGGHGFGLRPGNRPVNHWVDLFLDWMGDRGLLGPPRGRREL
jgi:acetyl esterase/lipase